MNEQKSSITRSYIKLPSSSHLIFDNDEIIRAIDRLATHLNQQLINENPVVLCVMQGGLVFSGHLIPRLNCMLEVDYIHATRYNNQITGSNLVWKSYPVTPLKNRTVLILDDILDEGETLLSIIQYCESQGASSVISAVLLKKEHHRCNEHKSLQTSVADNIALTVDDKYVFGFGMDMNGQYRQLAHIFALEQ